MIVSIASMVKSPTRLRFMKGGVGFNGMMGDSGSDVSSSWSSALCLRA